MNDVKSTGTPRTSSNPDHAAFAAHAALLIDFDNVTMGIRSDLQRQLRALLHSDVFEGKISVQRAYADWRRYPQYIVPLSEASIDLIFAPAFGANKKNATDIRLAIDALELVFTRPEIGTFVLLSGDSDFSSLVLKLKEYGKRVIGVGIRESSSDTLIQNCDEYYSYTDITGLTREGADEHLARDPWELVVQAALKMKRDGDVMRSDRLKQVMQELDPHFSEKDLGYSRFSKFVVEAAQRGLLRLERLDNGQHGIDIGDDANVPVGAQTSGSKERQGRAAGRSRRDAERTRRGRESARAIQAAGGRKLTLAEAFSVLEGALRELADPEGVPAGRLLEKVLEAAPEVRGDGSFESRRFQRLLRQAHDAELIDLAKVDDGYLVKLREPAVVRDRGPGGRDTEVEPEASSEEAGKGAAVREPAARRTRAKRARAPKSKSREAGEKPPEAAEGEQRPPLAVEKGTRASTAEEGIEDESEGARAPRSRRARTRSRRGQDGAAPPPGGGGARAESGAQAPPPPAGDELRRSPAPEDPSAPSKRHPRFRQGSRGQSARRAGASEESGSPPGPVTTGGGEQPPQKEPEIPVRTPSVARSIRGRPGSRARPPLRTGGPKPEVPGPAPAHETGSESREAFSEPPARRERESGGPEPVPDEPSVAEPTHGGFFRKMTTAFQKAVSRDSGDES